MDSLALICNLYGDGPATLRRLRDAGCGDLDGVASAPPEKLAGLLRTSARAARRFQAESRLLLSRVDSEAGVQVATEQAPKEHGDPLVRKVLDVWRERDAAEAGTDEKQEAVAAEQVVVETVTAADPLVTGCIESLDAGLCARLNRMGLATLRDLIARDGFEISREAGLPFTRVARLQLLARRAFEGLVESGQIERVIESEEPEIDVASPPRDERGTLWPQPGPTTTQVRAAAPSAAAQPVRFSPAERPATSSAGESGAEQTRLAAHRITGQGPEGEEKAPEAGPEEPSEGAGPFA